MLVARLALVSCIAAASACNSSSSTGSPALTVVAAGDSKSWTVQDIQRAGTTGVAFENAKYKGSPLKKLLGDSAPADASVVARGADGYTQTLAPASWVREDCIVAHEKDGKAIPAGEGPLRIVLAGSPGLSVRNLVELRVEKR
jgi:DMSO/TMAO reductase YedYZ molybdopterin-dependent catalytic subunit